VYDPGDLTSKGGQKRGLWNQYSENALQQAGTQAQRGSEFGTLMPGYQSLLNSGYSHRKVRHQQGTLGAIQEVMAQRLMRHRDAWRERTMRRGTARFSEQRHAAKAATSPARVDNQKLFADEALRRKMMGLQGIAQTLRR